MSETNYRPSGDLQGDDKALPNRGTRTGLNGDGYGADLGQDATNRAGRVPDTGSDPAAKSMPCDPLKR